MPKAVLLVQIVFFVALLGLVAYFFMKKFLVLLSNKKSAGERYIALGDSYTIGEGVATQDSWPAVLTRHLQQSGVDIQLIDSPGAPGWTTQEVLDNELPVYESSQPTFVTLMIGVNDWVHGLGHQTFRERLVLILNRIQAQLPNKNHVVILTIPDFSVTPLGAQLTGGRDVATGVASFNQVIVEEAKARSIQVIDIFPFSQQMKDQPDLIAPDGLHPSAKEYLLWEQLIFPVVSAMLKKE